MKELLIPKKTRVNKYHYGVWAVISEELDERIRNYLKNQELTKGGMCTRSSFTREAVVYFLDSKESPKKEGVQK